MDVVYDKNYIFTNEIKLDIRRIKIKIKKQINI